MSVGKFSRVVISIAALVRCAGSENQDEREELLSCDQLASRFSSSAGVTTRDCFERTFPGGYTAQDLEAFKDDCRAPVAEEGSQGVSSKACPSDGPFGLVCACAVNASVVYTYEVIVDGVLDPESTALAVSVCTSVCNTARGTCI